jgi:hypothetical protein
LRRVALAAAGLTAALGAGSGITASLHADLFDDAFITAVFARHLAQGQGLTWVPGDPPFWGPTSLLQVALLAVCSALGADLQIASHLLAALCWGVASGALVLILEESGIWAASLAGAAMALSPIPLQLASGMESGLFVALCLLTLLLQNHSRFTATGFAAAAATLARPEGALLFPLLALASLTGPAPRRAAWQRAACDLAPGFGILVAALVAMAVYVGSPVPQSIVAKRGFGCAVSGCFSPFGAGRAMVSALGWAQTSFLVAAALLGLGHCMRDRHTRWLAAWGALLLAAFTLGGAPDSPWYYVSLFPPLYASAASSLGSSWRFRRQLGTVLLLAIVAGYGFRSVRTMVEDPWGRSAHWNGEKRQLAAAILGDMAARRMERARVLAYEVGYFGWSIPGRVDDLLGVVTPGFQPCLANQDGDTVLARTRPDYVALVDTPTYPATGCIRTAGTLGRKYRVIESLSTPWGSHYEIWARSTD